MSEAYKFLKECVSFFVLSINGDFPAERPFGAVMQVGDNLYLSTNDLNEAHKQIRLNGNIQIVAKKPDSREWIRITGVTSECNDIDSKLKDEYYLNDDFGVLKEKDSFKNITSDFYENYFDYDNLSYENNLSSFTYLFLKAMPYISGNEEILCGIILLDLINNYDLYSKNYTYLNEIDLGIFIKEATENLKEDPLYLKEKITKLFYYEKNPTIRYKDPDSSLLKESTQENIINYIVEFIQKNKAYSGRYDYFRGKEPTKDPNDPFSEFYTSNVYKLHFHCEFNNFKLNVGKSMTKQNTLVFNVDGNAYIEAPIDLNRRDLFILNIYDEIKNKLAPDAFEELETDAIKKLDISLNHKLKDIFDIKKLKFEYIINWNIEITTDNGY